MKNRFLPVLLSAALLSALCACTPTERMAPPVTPSASPMPTVEGTPLESAPSASEFSLSVDDVWLALGDITACPREPEKTENGIFVYTQEKTLCTEYYDGLTLVRNSGYLLSADITAAGIPTRRSIQVGDSREQAETAYPEGDYSESSRAIMTYFEYPDAPGYYIAFYFSSDDTVERIYLGGGLD